MFFSKIEANQTLAQAFEKIANEMERQPYHRGQAPQLDSNGDGKANQTEDYLMLEDRYLPTNMVSLANRPQISKISSASNLEVGVSSQRIEVEISGVGITRVYATVIPPTFDSTVRISSWQQLQLSEFDLAKISKGKYAAAYANFTKSGEYTVVVNAENTGGFADPV